MDGSRAEGLTAAFCGKGRLEMLKKIGLGAIALIVLLIIVIATRPGTFRVERSASMKATPAAV